MNKIDIEKVYKEIKKRIDEKKLVLADLGVVEGFHSYYAYIVLKE